MNLGTTYTLIICVLLICKCYKNDGFGTAGMILFLTGFGSLALLASIGGFFNPLGTAHRVMGNIGQMAGAGLLIAALFVEMLSTNEKGNAGNQNAGGPPPPQF